ncbi:MAG: hypothetical protein O2794_00475 [bacterium]|nr:hypothetical protein [bacterium]
MKIHGGALDLLTKVSVEHQLGHEETITFGVVALFFLPWATFKGCQLSDSILKLVVEQNHKLARAIGDFTVRSITLKPASG